MILKICKISQAYLTSMTINKLTRVITNPVKIKVKVGCLGQNLIKIKNRIPISLSRHQVIVSMKFKSDKAKGQIKEILAVLKMKVGQIGEFNTNYFL